MKIAISLLALGLFKFLTVSELIAMDHPASPSQDQPPAGATTSLSSSTPAPSSSP